jgi:hypothetical protein
MVQSKMEFSYEQIQEYNSYIVLAAEQGNVPCPESSCKDIWNKYFEYNQGPAGHYRNAHPSKFTGQETLQMAKHLLHERQFKLVNLFIKHMLTLKTGR